MAGQGRQLTALALAAARALAGAHNVSRAVAIMRSSAAGITPVALRAATAIVMAMPPDIVGGYGPASSRAAQLNLIRRAQFLAASAVRIHASLGEAVSRNRSLIGALSQAVQRETGYYALQLAAGRNRAMAGAAVDSAAMNIGGLLLGWYSRNDRKTCDVCRGADRHNFWADQMPQIGYPGMVHLGCRCWPGPPVPGAPMIEPSERQPAYA